MRWTFAPTPAPRPGMGLKEQGIPPCPRRCSMKIIRRLTMKLEGVHHITAITGDAPGNVGFYAGTMGLRLVKKTVNQDDPTVYHLFYADEAGSPGADLTFFEYPGASPGRAGGGVV